MIIISTVLGFITLAAFIAYVVYMPTLKNKVYDERTGRWFSKEEVQEIMSKAADSRNRDAAWRQ